MKYNTQLIAAAGLLFAAAPAAFAEPTGEVRYRVSALAPQTYKFQVEMTVRSTQPRLRIAIPAWTPGYYQILNYQKDIADVRARGPEGRILPVAKADDRTWEVKDARGEVTVSYTVNAQDAGFGFFGSQLDERTGFINGASALMYPVGGTTLPAAIEFRLLPGWKLASSLDPDGPNRFKASNYDELIDCPMQMGELERLDFDVKGTPFSAVLVGATNPNKPKFVEMLTRISEQGHRLFGYLPFKRYLYIIHFSHGNFGGGLEHMNSTVLNVGPEAAANPYSLSALVAHEYAHAWNVKRLRPAVLGPFDYTKKVRTGALWFAEGVTEYYAHVLMRMAGIANEKQFLAAMAGSIAELQRTEARKRVTLEESSQKAWEGGSFGFDGLSYYNKGSVVGFAFDVKIREATNGAKSLDDVLRLLDERYGKANTGYPENGLRDAINEVAGTDLSAPYDRWVRSTEEIPWNEILVAAGLRYESGADEIPYLGITLEEPRGDLVRVHDVMKDTPAEAAGVRAGDRILALNGVPQTEATWQASVRRLKVGEKIRLAVRREGRRLELPMEVGVRRQNYTRIVELPDASEAAKRVRSGLVRAKAVGVVE